MSSCNRLFDGLKLNEVRHHRTKKVVRKGDIIAGEGCCGVAHLHHIKWSKLENVESGTVDIYVTPFKDMEGKPQGISYHQHMMEELQLWKEFKGFESRMYEKDGESKLRPRDYDITKEHQLFYGFTRKKFWSATSCKLNSWIVELYGYQGKIVKDAGTKKSEQSTQKKTLFVISSPLWNIIYKKISELCPYDGQPWSVAWATGAGDSDQPDFEEEQFLRMRCLVQSLTVGSQNNELLLEEQHIGLGGTTAVKTLASVLQEKVRGAYRVQNVQQLSLIGNSLTDEHIALLAPVFSKLESLEALHLGHNLIEDHGCRLLAHALPRKIKGLFISCNRIREHGAEILSTKAKYIDFSGNPNVPQIFKSRFELIYRLEWLRLIGTWSDDFLAVMLEVAKKSLMNTRRALKTRESQLLPFLREKKRERSHEWKEFQEELEWVKWESERQGLPMGLEELQKELEWVKSEAKTQGFLEASIKEELQFRKRYSIGHRVVLYSLTTPAYGAYNGLKGTINSSFDLSRRGWWVILDNGDLQLFEASYLRRLVYMRYREVPVTGSGRVLSLGGKNKCLRMIRLQRYQISMGRSIPIKKDFDVAVETLLTLAKNLQRYPGVQKYRELNLQNEALGRRLFRFPDCVRFLNNLGFQKQANKLIMQDEIPSVTAKAIEVLAQAVWSSPKKPIEQLPRMPKISNHTLLTKAVCEPSTLPFSQIEFDGEVKIDGRQNANFVKSGYQTFGERREMHIAPAEPKPITQVAAEVPPKVDALDGDEEKNSDSSDEDYEAMLMKAVFLSKLPRDKSLGTEAALVNRSSVKIVKDPEGTPKPDALAVYEQMDEIEEQSDSYEEDDKAMLKENDVIAKIQEGEVQRKDLVPNDTDSELQKYLFSQEKGAKDSEMAKTKFTTEFGSNMKFVAEVYNAPEQKDKDLGGVVFHLKNLDENARSDTSEVANNFCCGVASMK